MEENKVNEILDDNNQEKPFEFDKKDFIFAALSAVGCISTVIFGLFGNVAMGFCLSTLMLIFVLGVYLGKGNKIRATAISCGVLAFANTFNFIATSNGSVRFFSIVEIVLLCLVLFDSLANKEKENGIKRIFITIGSGLFNIPLSTKSLFLKKNGTQNTICKILIGVACAIPVLVIIISLLSSADLAFSGIMNIIIGDAVPTFAKTVLGLVLTTFVISYGFTLKKARIHDINLPKINGLETVFIASFLSVVSLAYLLYLFSQLAYFFSAFNSILPEGYKFTVAAYARRGFFELCAISVINLIIIVLSMLLSSKDGKLPTLIKIFCSFISFFTLIICVTAISKMVLYISEFGMTILRITTSAFIVFLMIVFTAIIFRIYIQKTRVTKIALLSAAVILLILGTVNVNAVSARYNYECYMNNTLSTIDVSAIADLGDEGVPYLVKLAQSTKNYNTRNLAKEYLKQCYAEKYFDLDEEELKNGLTEEILNYNKKYKSFKYFSIPKYKAYQSLYEYAQKNPKSFRY